MKRALEDYLRSMRISSEVSHPKPKLISNPNFQVKIVEIDSEEVEPFMTDNKASNMFKDRFTQSPFRSILGAKLKIADFLGRPICSPRDLSPVHCRRNISQC